MDLSLIIPAYNEAERIAAPLRTLRPVLESLGLRHEILVVDDGSTDETAARVAHLARSIPELRLRLIEGRENRGKGHAVRRGMLAARGAIRVMLDADGATDLRALPSLLAPLEEGEAEVAIGSRYLPGARILTPQPLHRRVFSRLANRLVQHLLLPGLVDAHCGFKAFTAGATELLFSQSQIDGWSFDLEILALARRADLRIAEVPVRWSDDARSRVAPLRDLVASTRELLAIRARLGRQAV